MLKTKKITLSKIVLLICLTLSSYAQDHKKWLQGYAKALEGGIIKYHSPQPDVNSALLVRSLDAKEYIEWETEPVPEDLKENFVSFIWIFGIDVNSECRKFDLYINKKKWFSFFNPLNSEQTEWSIDGKDGAELNFRATLVDKHDDLMGYASLKLPKNYLQPGKPLIMKVAGESAGSNAWYMTFQSNVKSKATIVPLQAIIRIDNQLFQPVNVNLVHIGEPVHASISTQGNKKVETQLKFGYNTVQLLYPEVKKERAETINIKIGDQEVSTEQFRLKPVRKWTIYLVHHTHTDIGYTRPQTEILPEHLRYIDYALDFCDLTDKYPDDARFRWTCEASWAVHEYLKSRPAEQIERLKKRVQEGRIEITGMLFNMSEIPDESSIVSFLQPVRLFREHGLKVTTAMQNDVNGAAWCLVDYFNGTGIKYLTMGQHGHRALVPFDKPTSFWWESPSGKRMLAFRADHYNTGNFWGIHTGKFETIEPEIFKYLQNLEKKDYPFDRITVQYSGYFTDNSPPAIVGCEMIKQWNKKYEWPKLRSATAHEFMEYIEKNHSDELSVYRAAWPEWWTDGFGSAARETGASRRTHAEMLANQGALSMALMLGSEIPAFVTDKIKSIQEALLFFDEHTFGAAESISDPMVENSMVQWAEKSAYVWEAVKSSGMLREAAMGLLQSYISKSNVPVIALFNTLNWERSGLHEVYIDHEILPINKAFRIVDNNGKKIAAQALKSRADGTYWGLWVENIPAMGYKIYRIEVTEKEREALKEYNPESNILENSFYKLAVDSKTGAVTSLFDKEMNLELVDQNSKWELGQFIYETLSNREQLEQFRLVGYSRTLLKNIKVKSGIDGPIWKSIKLTGQSEGCDGTEGVKCEIRLYKKEKRIEFHFTIRKLRNTKPEAIYVAFPFDLPGSKIIYEAQGGMVTPGENQLPGTASDWNTVQNFASVRNGEGQIILGSDQIPLIQFGDLNIGKFQYIANVEKPYMFSWVMNNYWVTNFKASQEGEFKWSYYLTSTNDNSNTFATHFGWGSRVPFLSRVLPAGKQTSTNPSISIININTPNVLLISAKPAFDNKGIILHLREVDGKSAEVSLNSLFEAQRIKSIEEVNVLEENIVQLTSTLKLKPYEVKFVRLSF